MLYRYPLANDNRFDVLLSKEQIKNVEDRDLLAALNNGFVYDVYMSCIDPTYPKLIK